MGTCDNLLSIRRDVLETKVLDGLKHQLMHPKMVTAFIEEFHREVNRQRAQLDGQQDRTARDLEKTEREIRWLIEAIKSGVPGIAVKDEMACWRPNEVSFVPSSRRHPLPCRARTPTSPSCIDRRSSTSPRPSMKSRLVLEATQCMRELIEEIRRVPEEGQLRIELYGELASLINLANGHPRSKGTGVQVTLVAGTRNRLDLQLRLLTTVALEQGLVKALSSSPECPL